MFRSKCQFLKKLTGTTRAFLESKAAFNYQSPFTKPNKGFQTPLCRFNFSSEKHEPTAYELIEIRRNRKNELYYAKKEIDQACEFQARGDYKEAQTLLKKALERSEKVEESEYDTLRAKVYGSMGQTSFEQKEWSQAVEFYKQSEKHINKNNQELSSAANLQVVLASSNLRDMDGCLEYSRKFIKSAESTGDTQNLGGTYLMIGGIYKHRRMLKEALEAFEKAEKLYEQHYGKEHPHTQEAAQKAANLRSLVEAADQWAS